MAGHSTVGEAAVATVHDMLPDLVDPAGKSVTQLAQQSMFMIGLHSRPLPAGLNVTSIGAREDVIVPAGVTRLDGAHNVTISAPGAKHKEHSSMPGAAETQREIALGLAGRAPTCQSFGDFAADALVSDWIRTAENGAAVGAWMAGRRLDKGLDSTLDRALEPVLGPDSLQPTIPRRSN